jgi:hypothetical protein
MDEAGRQRFTTREMFEAERSLLHNADKLAQRAFGRSRDFEVRGEVGSLLAFVV